MAYGKFAVIGIGQFGSAIARTLSERGAEVIAIDTSINKIEAIKDDVAHAVACDATDKKNLLSQNIEDMDAVIVAIGENFEGLLLCTFNLMELKVKRIIARAMGEEQKSILQRMGVTEILSPENEVGISVAEKLLNPNVIDIMELPDGYEIAEIKAPINIIDRSIEDINLREKYKLNLVTIIRPSENEDGQPIQNTIGVPNAQTTIRANDLLVIFGSMKNINRFTEINS